MTPPDHPAPLGDIPVYCPECFEHDELRSMDFDYKQDGYVCTARSGFLISTSWLFARMGRAWTAGAYLLALVVATTLICACTMALGAQLAAAAPSSLDVARKAWSSPNACGGRVHVVVEELPGKYMATASFMDPYVGPGGYFDCVITIDPDVPIGWRRRCAVVHEYGHLLIGIRHIDRPTSIMQSAYEDLLEAPSCRRLRATSPR